MQDTSYYQNNLINLIFDESKVIIQKFGDSNQSIYENNADNQNVWNVTDDCLCINESKRFSNAIAHTTKNFCMSRQNVIGNSSIMDISPKILIFDDNTKEHVLYDFAKIIREYSLEKQNNRFKAVGWVGIKKDDKRTLPSYYANYRNKSQTQKAYHNNLSDYLKKVDEKTIKDAGVNYYRKSIINLLLNILRMFEIKEPEKTRYFTEKSLIRYLHIKDTNFENELYTKITEWCLKIQNDIDVIVEIKDFIKDDFCSFFEITDIGSITPFLDGETGRSDAHIPRESLSNTYKNDLDIDIEVSTIHNVKGETHTATLYLETFYYGYDVKRVLKYLKDGATNPKDIEKQSMKMAYVGMTRPTHLLCVAMHKENINIDTDEAYLNELGWEIREVHS